MSFTGIYQFGTITTRTGQVLRFEDVDTDGDGKISQQEFNFIQKELCMDTVELSDSDSKGEKQVTDSDYAMWSLEMQMQNALNDMIAQVAKDFIGSNAQYSTRVISELRDFLKDYTESYKNSDENIAEMADKFAAALPIKYNEIKEGLLG